MFAYAGYELETWTPHQGKGATNQQERDEDEDGSMPSHVVGCDGARSRAMPSMYMLVPHADAATRIWIVSVVISIVWLQWIMTSRCIGCSVRI